MIALSRRALAGLLALIGASVLWVAGATPASAYVCSFGIDGPAPGATSASSTVTVTGDFAARQGVADRVVEVTFTQSPGARPDPVTRRGDVGGGPDRYAVPLGPLPLNGQYTARVRASHEGTGLLGCDDGVGPDGRDGARVDEVTFGVSVRANPPTNVQVRFDAGPRTAAVTWEKSGDPDIVGYTVSRKVGSASPTAVQVPADPLRWTDTKLPSGAASVTYSVQASRRGPAVGTTSEPSAPVAAPAISVPAPTPSSAPTTAPPTTRAGAAGSTAATLPFVLGPPVGGTPATLPSLSDPAASGVGGEALVPYSPGPEQATLPDLGGGDQPAVSDEVGGGGISPKAVLGGVGLLAAGGAAFVLLLRRRGRRRPDVVAGGASPPLEPVPVADVPPPGPMPAGDLPPVGLMASPFAPSPAAATEPPRPVVATANGPASGAAPAASVWPDDDGVPIVAAAPSPPARRPLRAERPVPPDDEHGPAIPPSPAPVRVARATGGAPSRAPVRVAAVPAPSRAHAATRPPLRQRARSASPGARGASAAATGAGAPASRSAGAAASARSAASSASEAARRASERVAEAVPARGAGTIIILRPKDPEPR